MKNYEIAKNLLLGKTCVKCMNAAHLADRSDVSNNDNNRHDFELITGYSFDDIYEGCYLVGGDMLFDCSLHHKLIPPELTCDYFEQSQDI